MSDIIPGCRERTNFISFLCPSVTNLIKAQVCDNDGNLLIQLHCALH